MKTSLCLLRVTSFKNIIYDIICLPMNLSMDKLKSSEKELFASIFIRDDVLVKQGIRKFKETF